MEVVAKSCNDYENVALRADPTFVGVEELIELLKNFIREKGLCIYGGLAIDYALRLHGDEIYPADMLQVDYDFFSPDNVEHAYDCADMFYEVVKRVHGEEAAAGVRAINALHVKTMRVDIRDNHFLADITYCPADVFEKLPTLTYDGMKIIHPDMQRIDIHSSLTFPYDNAPTEVLFNRWKKDITRFNLLAEYYPLLSAGDVELPAGKVEIPKLPYVICGLTAYGLIYETIREKYNDIPADILAPAGANSVRSAVKQYIIGDVFEIVHMNPAKCIEELKLAHCRKYRPLINMIPETVTGMAEFGKVCIDDTSGRLVSIVSTDLGGRTYRIVSAQYLLKQFLAFHHRGRMSGENSNLYLNLYVSTMKLIEFEHGKNDPLPITRLSVVTYGAENVNLSKEVAIRRVLTDIGQAASDYLPSNYYPAKRVADLPRIKYDLSRNVLFKESGEEYGE